MTTRSLRQGDVVLGLAYSTATSVTIAHCEVIDDHGSPLRALFARKRGEISYVQIPAASGISQQWFALSSDAPFLFINEFASDGNSQEWHRLIQVSLLSNEERVLLAPGSKCWSPGALRGWVTQLLGDMRKGESLVCVRAEEWPLSAGGTDVVYEIVEFGIERKQFKALARLEHAFY